MTKHTPGPWEWQTSNSWRRLGSVRGDGDVMYPCVQRDGHPDVTFKNGGVEGPDARLIAAAPDLLDALERLVEKADESDDARYGTLSTAFVRDIALAALAKVGE